MMSIYDMIIGHKYLIGDGLGYDIVICIGQGERVKDIPYPIVRVRFINENNREDILFESPNCGFSTYVEPR